MTSPEDNWKANFKTLSIGREGSSPNKLVPMTGDGNIIYYNNHNKTKNHATWDNNSETCTRRVSNAMLYQAKDKKRLSTSEAPIIEG